MKRLVPALLVSVGLIAAACGGDDGGTTDAPTTDASTTEAPTTDAPDETSAPGDTPAPTAPAGDCALDEPLKIGFAADLGELGAFSDQPGSEAAQVQVDLINAAGGVGGQQVEYVIKDVQGDPAATQRAAEELLADGVHAMIGPPFANTGAPLLDTVNGQVPIIFMASTDASLADPARGGFLASFSDQVQSSAAASFALAEGKMNAVTFSSPDDIYFSGNPEYFAEAFENGGGTVVQDFSFSLADEDFSTQVNELASLDPQPDVLFTAMVQPQIGTLLEQMQGAGVEDVMVIGADGFDATLVWTAGDVAEGVYFTSHTFPNESNGVQAFLDEAASAGANIETLAFGALAADAVQVIAAAVTASCSLDGPTISAAIDGLVNQPVTTGTVTFAGTGGVPEKDVVILTVTDGAPAFVEALRPEYIAGS